MKDNEHVILWKKLLWYRADHYKMGFAVTIRYTEYMQEIHGKNWRAHD